MKRPQLLFLVAAVSIAACDNGASPGAMTPMADPLAPYYPSLPPTGGPAVAAAGVLTADNFAKESVAGPAAQGLVGDYFMRNDKIRVVVQKPGRAVGPCPYGGDLIDLDSVGSPRGDQFGELSLLMQGGRTVDFRDGQILRDGSQGGPAVIRFVGKDVRNDFFFIQGLGGLATAIEDQFGPRLALGITVAVTYILEPGADHVKAVYTFYNPSPNEVDTMWGTLSDTGAQIEVFHAGFGFGLLDIATALKATGTPPVEYAALQGQGVAYGIVPEYGDPAARGSALPVAGVDVEIYDVPKLFDAFGPNGQQLKIPAQAGINKTVDLYLAPDVGGIEAAVRALRNEPVGQVAGTVTTTSGKPVAGARVAVERTDGQAMPLQATAYVADGNGKFAGSLPPGTYDLTAEGDSMLRGSSVSVTVAANTMQPPVAVTIPDAAYIGYKIHDGQGNPLAGKIDVVGTRAATPDRRFRDISSDYQPVGIAGFLDSRLGDSTKMTRWDHPIAVAAGHYRVVVGHGPEWSRHEEVVDVAAGQMLTIDAQLDHVVDTTGYVACDFHQHTYMSPDSPVPPEDRIVTYLADGVEFISSSDHDMLFDFKPVIQMHGAVGLIDNAVGEEVTPWDYGHFIGWPLKFDPTSVNGGAFDWGLDPMTGDNVPPGGIFAGLRGIGAQVTQVNHPRVPFGTDVMSTFQKNFDRAGLSFDFAGHQFGGSTQLQPVEDDFLGLPDNAAVFSKDFDAVEVVNGASYATANDSGDRADPATDIALRDWMDFLDFGFTPTMVGDSDSHRWITDPAGVPRTMVRVPDDSMAGVAAGLAGDVAAAVSGKTARDVVVTNGPMLGMTVDGKGIGQVAVHPLVSGALNIAVDVQAPAWVDVDTVEIYANATFDVPVPKGEMPTAFAPVLCFTSRGAPSQRCQGAIGGARPLVLQAVTLPSGGVRMEAKLTATVDPQDLLARNRAGAGSQDLWLMARAMGDVGLFPTIPLGITDESMVPDIVDHGTQALAGIGIPALAMTNPVYVDVDGNGYKAPFAQ